MPRTSAMKRSYLRRPNSRQTTPIGSSAPGRSAHQCRGPALAVDDASDLLMMLGSQAPYLALRRYGWSEEKYVGWLTDALATQLLARPGGRKKQ